MQADLPCEGRNSVKYHLEFRYGHVILFAQNFRAKAALEIAGIADFDMDTVELHGQNPEKLQA